MKLRSRPRPLFGIPSEVVIPRDGFGSVDPDRLLNDIRYLVKINDVKWIILDHLSILLSGNESNDERKMIDVVMTVRSFVEETGIGLLLISYLRRNQGDQSQEDGARVSPVAEGIAPIAQLSDQSSLSSGTSLLVTTDLSWLC